MSIQHSPPARKSRSQARTQAVFTPTPRASLDGTPAVPQLRAKLDRVPILEGAERSRKEGRGPRRSRSFSGVVGRFPGTSRTIFGGPGEDGEEEEENYVEEEESDGTEGVPVSQKQGMTPLHGCFSNLAWNQVVANWPHHIFYGQLAPFGHSTFP
ncbi:hypothetical protein O181_065024 [Austropuccinia psidii MF-1]|uniref:Uncharacterized protein n=1 Tax=Austropuccinia psidii MF-1 TaxID=1389203 RepID=A0A9Q3I452_9BASI|nr:hypothetical protein [Austropuccinia psidii MF-1]